MVFVLLINANSCRHFNIYEQEKFHAQLSNLEARTPDKRE